MVQAPTGNAKAHWMLKGCGKAWIGAVKYVSKGLTAVCVPRLFGATEVFVINVGLVGAWGEESGNTYVALPFLAPIEAKTAYS